MDMLKVEITRKMRPAGIEGDIEVGKIIPCSYSTDFHLWYSLLLVGTNIDKGLYFILGDIIIIQYLINNFLLQA